MDSKIAPHTGWLNVIGDEFKSSNMMVLKKFLLYEKENGKQIFPPEEQIFYALNRTHFNSVKVVILGQDPYHNDNQAHGLSFSVQAGITPPPSLKNIYKEMENDLGLIPPNHGCLDSWAGQGILLLNSVLTVEAHKAGSHQGKGWEQFTDRVIRELEVRRKNLVFILWGAYARKKGNFIRRERHLVLEGPHPSPLSSYRGFFGSRPFSKTNEYLKETGQKAVNWKL